jgi:hypothetical protein
MKNNKKIKWMTFIEALEKMEQGHKVQASDWLKHDYLYIENNKLMCDGGFEFTKLLSIKEQLKKWRIVDERYI